MVLMVLFSENKWPHCGRHKLLFKCSAGWDKPGRRQLEDMVLAGESSFRGGSHRSHHPVGP